MQKSDGLTLIELLLVMAVFGIVLGIAALNLRPLEGKLESAANNLSGLIRQGRSKAMGTTTAYRLVLPAGSSSQEFAFEWANNNCRHDPDAPAGTWTADGKLTFTLPEGVTFQGLTPSDAQLCFNSRGITADTPQLLLEDDKGNTRTLQVFAGGMVEIE